MQNLAQFILTEFKDDGVEPVAHPTDGQVLFRYVGTLVQPIS
jgi:hypothetical protein